VLRPLRRLAVPAVLIASLGALAGCGEDSGSSATDSSGSSSSGASTSGGAASGGSCDYPAAGPAAKDVEPPPASSTVTGSVPVVMATSVADLHLTLDADATPCTVGSFVSLAEQGYFDGTSCHRLTTAGIYVLQCGDPTGSGSGGPGYSFPDELTGKETYPAGTLAMANAGPDTNGSQFFIVYGATQLPPSYTVFGRLDAAGVKAVTEIARAGTDNAFGQGDGHPNKPVRITKVTVEQ
jgi:peptidyl-prolyl cis-trans isomerase B (cyclophilin B)